MKKTIELRLWRFVGNGLHEEIDISNRSQTPSKFLFQIEVNADFASLRETQGKRQQFGKITNHSRQTDSGLEVQFDYRSKHQFNHQGEEGIALLKRGILIRVDHPTSKATYGSHAISFTVDLKPGERWHTCLNYWPILDDQPKMPRYSCRAYRKRNSEDCAEEKYLESTTEFNTSESGTLSSVVVQALLSAKRDLASLRLYDLGEGDEAWVPAAGTPKYLELFGRDPLIAGMQSGLLGPAILKGTLSELPKSQGTHRDDWRDEAPGRLIHQLQDDPLSHLGYEPLGRYYGTLSAPALYAEALFTLWIWTGDDSKVREFLGPALKAMKWLETTTNNDKDQFYAYCTKSEQGVKNQSWKDSGDAIVYEDGSLVPAPIATSEMQGLAYAAKLQLGFLLDRLGEKDLGSRFKSEASEFKKRFNDHFWMESESYFALGKDSKGRLIRSISSDPGACLASGIVDESVAERTVTRLMKSDLFSGWGIRTISTNHPAYDPFSYHRGSVWPVENAFIALGFLRYGFRDLCETLLRAQFEAASLFEYCRLPEVFSGHERTVEDPIPIPYQEATWPQAWSASAVSSFIQTLLGIFPFAPLETLFIDPHLPEWLPELTLRKLHVGRAKVSLRFIRKTGGKTEYEILESDGNLRIVRETSPWLKISEPL